MLNIETIKNTVIQDDCMNVLRELPDKCVDLVLTDPPYGIGYAEWDFIDFEKLINKIVKIFKRILKDGGTAFIWFPKKFIYKLEKVKFEFDVFIETKNFAQVRKNQIMIDCWVPILMIRNGNKQGNKQGKNWFMVNTANTGNNDNNPRKIDHPTVKDIQICKYIINANSNIDDIVLDPFAGSGTTGVAAKALHRNYILIEKEPKYVEICNQRLRQGILI